MRRRWEEEAAQEAGEEAPRRGEDLFITGEIASVDELKKKGNFVVEIVYNENDRVTVVTDNKNLAEGQKVKVALEGAVLDNGKTVKASKVGGEWSMGQIFEVLGNSDSHEVENGEAAGNEGEGGEGAEDGENIDDFLAAGGSRQRKNKPRKK